MDRQVVADVVARVFPTAASLTWAPAEAPPGERFWVVPVAGWPRWLVPHSPTMGLGFLRSWRPYRTSSRLKWGVILNAYRAGLLGSLPGVVSVGVAGAADARWTHLGWDQDPGPVPVIYVSGSGSRAKAVVALVHPDDGGCDRVAKVSLAPSAAEGIVREASVLERLQTEKPGVAPRLHFVDGERGVAVQAAVLARPTGRRLTPHHVDWLQGLRIEGASTTVRDQAARLAADLGAAGAGEAAERTLGRTLDRLTDTTRLPASWVHGDLAPWNLRRRPSGSLVALDWEYADSGGFLFADAFYFRRIQDYLFARRSSLAEVARAIAPRLAPADRLLPDLDRLSAVATAIRHLGPDGDPGFRDHLLTSLEEPARGRRSDDGREP